LRADQTESLLDRTSSITGKAAAWLTLFMVIVTFIVVIMRYVFDAGLAGVRRVDARRRVHARGCLHTARRRARARGYLLPNHERAPSRVGRPQSWSIGESSRESGGLPYPFVPLLKSVQLLMPIAVSLQGLSLLVRSVKTLRGG
jgi:TRAP-type mannitol/chloroaromatic compound transport system permease small subunit